MGFLVTLDITRQLKDNEDNDEIDATYISILRDKINTYSDNDYFDNLFSWVGHKPIALLTDEGVFVDAETNKRHRWVKDIVKQPVGIRWEYAQYKAMETIVKQINPYIDKTTMSKFEPDNRKQNVKDFYQAGLECFNMELLLTMHNMAAAHMDGETKVFRKADVQSILSEQYGNIIQYTSTLFELKEDSNAELILPNPGKVADFERITKIHKMQIDCINDSFGIVPFSNYPLDTGDMWGHYDLRGADMDADTIDAIIYVEVTV